MRRDILAIGFAAIVLAGLQAPRAHGEVLITQAEAELPNVTAVTRGLTRGPGIEQLAPNPSQTTMSPVSLMIKFVPRNNVAIDPASVKLIYLKSKPIDLTERIKKYVTADGIDMVQAEVPPGTHMMRLEVKDQQGRNGFTIIKFIVAGR